MKIDEYHGLDCICETCIQNYPERSYLLPVEEEEMMSVDEIDDNRTPKGFWKIEAYTNGYQIVIMVFR